MSVAVSQLSLFMVAVGVICCYFLLGYVPNKVSQLEKLYSYRDSIVTNLLSGMVFGGGAGLLSVVLGIPGHAVWEVRYVMKMWRYQHEAGSASAALLLRWFCLVIFSFVIPFSVNAAGEDDYLSALQQEAGKVGAKPSESTVGGTATDKGSERLSRESFENELREKYAGSAVFYSKLGAGSQEEIYQEYQSGATISELRKKIMDRFLHR